MTGNGNEWMPIGKMIDEKVVVNGIVALLATGGSTNHTMHLVAMARAAGIQINWDDFSDLSQFQRGMAACQTLFAILDSEQEKDEGTRVIERAKGNLKFENALTPAQSSLRATPYHRSPRQ